MKKQAKMKLRFFSLLLLFSNLLSFSQKADYSTLNIPDNLKENANSIVVNQEVDIVINSQKEYTISTFRIVKILNEYGLRNIDAVEHYDKSNRIKKMDAKMYDSFGNLLKDFKQKDFKDQSVADGFSIINDARVMYLDITPTQYPFTIVYTSEIVSENTAFIPSWSPINNVYESVWKSTYSITYPDNLGFKYKEINFKDYTIIKNQDKNRISYSVANFPAVKMEDYSPALDKFIPKVLFGLEKFSLEGVEGDAKSWKDFGLWRYNALLADTEQIDEATKKKIQDLVGTESDPIKKARLIYKFVQDKTRYVSIQLGIGGWKPMLAKDVDRLGYGDCKALTNYTRVLLKSVGVDSYYTVIYGDRVKKDFETDFVSMQGNHIILSIPQNNKLTFLECTDQNSPFGYQGYFTDDRYALMVKPDGGEIVKTTSYTNKDNIQKMTASYAVAESGELEGSIQILSKGIQYENSYHIENKSAENIDTHYKERFSNLSNFKLKSYQFFDDPIAIEFTEKLNCKVENYGSLSGNSLIFPVNPFNQYNRIPKRYRTRNNPFEIDRGFFDEDEIEINLPPNYVVDAQPEPFAISDKFGEYKAELTVINPSKIKYKRSLLINKGLYDKSEYESFRKFVEQVAKADNSKIVLTKKP